MSMDKRWGETFARLEAIEKALKELQGQPAQAAQTAVTKEQLMEIKGVGSSTADEILKLING